jgi:hypothetical protein
MSLFYGTQAPLEAFTLISNEGDVAYWPNGSTSFQFNSSTSGYFEGGVDLSGTSADEFSSIRSSFQVWAQLPGLQLSISELPMTSTAPSSGDQKNTLMWVRQNWRGLSFRPPTNALAVTLLSFDSSSGVITDADIYFNAETFRWAVVDAPSEINYVDVQNIATHEIGHFLGLDHSSEDIFEGEDLLSDATMYFASTSGETLRRDLNEDDILGITALYGASGRGVPSIQSIEVDSASSGSVQYRIRGENFNEYTSFILTKRSASELDVVARYRTIVSSSEAVAEFDILGLSDGKADVLAFNDPQNISSFAVTIDSGEFQATESGGGGGGCALRSADSPMNLFGVALVLVVLSLIYRRRLSKI